MTPEGRAAKTCARELAPDGTRRRVSHARACGNIGRTTRQLRSKNEDVIQPVHARSSDPSASMLCLHVTRIARKSGAPLRRSCTRGLGPQRAVAGIRRDVRLHR